MPDIAPILFFITCILFIGFIIGQMYEAKYGVAAKEVKRYHKIILRVIPALTIHYSSQYISDILIQGDDDASSNS